MPIAERNSPSGPFMPSDTAMTHWSYRVKASCDLGQEALLVERDFGQQQDVRRIALAFGGKRGCGGRPARMPAHHFHR